jgi:hypothetical protein
MRLSPFAPIDALRAPPPDPARVAWLAGREYAHRGLHDDAVPENSPAAFAGAIARGMGIECDVQKTADGRAMVFHDWELDRLTDQTGPTGARTVAELEQLTLLGSAERIPSRSNRSAIARSARCALPCGVRWRGIAAIMR